MLVPTVPSVSDCYRSQPENASWQNLRSHSNERSTIVASSGTAGRTTPRIIAAGDGWTVADVVCTCGPQDRPFEEQHQRYSIAVVLAGSFQYRSTSGGGLMTPGSLMLGNSGQCFECGHEHGEGDRCVAFWYEPHYFEGIAADAGMRGVSVGFKAPRLPPLRPLSPLIARAAAAATDQPDAPWDELAIRLAACAAKLTARLPLSSGGTPPNAEARVTRTVRASSTILTRP